MMELRNALVVSLLIFGAASAAFAQPDVYVSGLQHVALGAAQFGPVDGRRLPVHNLGSSGEDGVEVQLNSAFGGGAEVDLQPFLSTPGATLYHKHKGWDGLIYGNHRMVSNGDGTGILACDYTEAGATEIEIARRDVNGNLISAETYPGPLVDYPLNSEIFYCPPGTQPTVAIWRGRLCNTCPWEERFVFFCDGVMYTEQLVVTPTFPVGTPDNPGFESALITGSGIPELTVSNAHVRTFGVVSWGLGLAQISEQCDIPGGCTPAERKLHADNLGSSGLDGVAVALPPNNGGVSVALAKGNCCRGHVIIMKLYDDEGQEQRVMMTQTTDPNGTEELDADFSAIGANGYVLTAYGPGGVVIGPPEGTAIIGGGGPKVVVGNPCPPGSKAIWQNNGTTSNPVWVFVGCLGIPMDLVIPGVGTLSGVASFQIKALNPTSSYGPSVRCEVLSDDPEGLVIDDIVVTPVLKGDLNCDGTVNFGDINPFVLRLSSPAAYHAAFPGCPDTNGDTNGDGSVNFGDINPFVNLLSSGG